MMTAQASFQRFYAIIRHVPPGKVVTYGQVAELAGLPRRSRLVGHALKMMPEPLNIPWWRVVNSQGRISPRGLSGSDEYQRLLLEEEGVVFSDVGKIDLRCFQWQPDAERAVLLCGLDDMQNEKER
ncbi:methylated-DNA-protein-cysteine methyltransferase-like protein [Chitinivorax tropicus]|uniref:Methylated-DNA-protein-cysteine methyltransferase-like protein n=1 Tax=Chitinivorax tropicus TaxID=714531 RepID=A0A840MM59_9PROT|nr:MGMT family protein [Chitinivorax tropicus]MBB5017283.1 methylated-DNA-protein-cysteine methyltransferase-like protein [Chitinivorax tropicus]